MPLVRPIGRLHRTSHPIANGGFPQRIDAGEKLWRRPPPSAKLDAGG